MSVEEVDTFPQEGYEDTFMDVDDDIEQQQEEVPMMELTQEEKVLMDEIDFSSDDDVEEGDERNEKIGSQSQLLVDHELLELVGIKPTSSHADLSDSPSSAGASISGESDTEHKSFPTASNKIVFDKDSDEDEEVEDLFNLQKKNKKEKKKSKSLKTNRTPSTEEKQSSNTELDNIDEDSSNNSSDSEEDAEKSKNGEDASPEEETMNKVVAAEIAAVKEIERGPTEAEMRRMKLIELDPDEAEEKIERFKRLGTEAISKATGLSRDDRIKKLRSSRMFLSSLWKSKQYIDMIETYVEKQLGRLFGDEDAPFDPIAYLEQDSYSDDEEEEKQKSLQAVAVEANSNAASASSLVQEDMIALSDSDSDGEHDDDFENKKPVAPAPPVSALVEEAGHKEQSKPLESVPAVLVSPSKHRLAAQFRGQQQRKLFLAPVRVAPTSRAALMISLRQKVLQTATENYCHQKRIKQEDLSQQLEIADHCRALVELLRDHFQEKEMKILAERQARFEQMAEDDEDAEFGEETGMEEGKFLSEEERRRLYQRYRRYQDDEEDEEDGDEDYEEEEDEEGDEDGEEDAEDGDMMEESKENNEVIQEELFVNEDLAANDTKPELSFKKATSDREEEEDAEDDEENMQVGRKTAKRNKHVVDDDDEEDGVDDAPRNETDTLIDSENNKDMDTSSVPATALSAAAAVTSKKFILHNKHYGRRATISETVRFSDADPETQSLADSDHEDEERTNSRTRDEEEQGNATTSSSTANVSESQSMPQEVEDAESSANATTTTSKKASKSKEKLNTGNALYRMMLEEEEKRFRNQKKSSFIDDEAEEEEEEGYQAGLGDFGFGNVSNMRDAEDEKNALRLQKGDLDHIVDDVSEGEGDEEAEREAVYAMELKEDHERTKMIVEAITEGHEAFRQRKHRRKQGYSFETLVTGKKAKDMSTGDDDDANKENNGDKEANNAEEELDFEEMLQRGLSAKMDREKRRRYNDEDEDDDDEDGYNEYDDDEDNEGGDGNHGFFDREMFDEDGNPLFPEGFVGANGEIWTKDMILAEKERIQRERDAKRAQYLRRKQMDKDFKMRRELRYMQVQRMQSLQRTNSLSATATTSNITVNPAFSSSSSSSIMGLPSSLPANARINPAILSRIAPSSTSVPAAAAAAASATTNTAKGVVTKRIQRIASVNQTIRKIRSVSSVSASTAAVATNANSNMFPPAISLSRTSSIKYSGELSRLELETGVGMVSTASGLPTPTNAGHLSSGSNGSTPRGLFQMVTNSTSSGGNNSSNTNNHVNSAAAAAAMSRKRSFSSLLHDQPSSHSRSFIPSVANSNSNHGAVPPAKRLARSISNTAMATTTTTTITLDQHPLSSSATNENVANGASASSLFSKLQSQPSLSGRPAAAATNGLKRSFTVMSTTTAQ